MTPEEIAAVEALTASLNEFTSIWRNIMADFDLLTTLDPVAAHALLAAIAKANNGVAK